MAKVSIKPEERSEAIQLIQAVCQLGDAQQQNILAFLQGMAFAAAQMEQEQPKREAG